MQRSNVLILIPNLGKGGAQQVYRDQLQLYAKYGQVLGCVFNWDGSFEEERQLGIVSLNVPAGSNVVSKIYFFFKRVYRLRKIKREHSIDISISHLEGGDYVNILSRRNEKIICWIHGTKKYDGEIAGVIGWIRKKILIPRLYEKSNLIITVSEGIRKELIQIFGLSPIKIKTIFNGISVSDVEQAARIAGSGIFPPSLKSHFTLITHCRLARQKNLGALLKIFATLKKNKSVKLVILGDGELREQLIDQCKSLYLATFSCWEKEEFNESYDVYFMGYQTNPYTYLAKASLYLMTSSWEGFPLALCEAMACQIPVMASDCYTGPREILAPEIQSDTPIVLPYTSASGILMPLADSDNSIRLWSTTVDRVLADVPLRTRVAKGGSERVRAFDKSIINKQWLEIMEG